MLISVIFTICPFLNLLFIFVHLFILLLSKTDETMDKKIYYSNVPDGFVHCFNASCKFADSCLRFQMGRVISSTCKTVNVVNPSFSSLFSLLGAYLEYCISLLPLSLISIFLFHLMRFVTFPILFATPHHAPV